MSGILDNRPLSHPTDMNIQSEILHPIQFNQKSTKFVFDNKGVLDSNSRLNLAITRAEQTSINVTGSGAAAVLGTIATTNISVASMDSQELLGTQAPMLDVNGNSFRAQATGSSSTAVKTLAADLEIIQVIFGNKASNVTAAIAKGLQVANVTKSSGAGISLVTAIDLTTGVITCDPALASGTPDNNDRIMLLQTDEFWIAKGTGTMDVSTTENYYAGMEIYYQVNDGGAGAATIMKADIVTSKEGSLAGVGDRIIITTTNRRLATNDAITAGTHNKLALMGVYFQNTAGDATGTLSANSKLLTIFNPHSATLAVGAGEDGAQATGHWNGYALTTTGGTDLATIGGASTPRTRKLIYRYFLTAAEAAAHTPDVNLHPLEGKPSIVYFTKASPKWVVGPNAQTYTMAKHEYPVTTMLPISTGVASLIKRAILTIGGREVSSLDEVGHFNTIKNLLNSTEHRQKIDFHIKGINDGMAYKKNVAGIDGFIGMKLSSDTTEVGVPLQIKIQSTIGETPEFSLALSDLIPMLRGVKLPLFAMKQEVALFIEFSEDINGHRVCEELQSGYTYEKTTIHEESCFLMTDYLYYDEEIDALQTEINRGGWKMPYNDMITINSTLNKLAVEPAQASPHNFTKTETNTLLYLGGKTINSIIVQKQGGNADLLLNVGNNRLEGIYNSRGLQRPESYNLLVDNVPIYDSDIRLSGLQYQEFSRVYDNHLEIPFARYSLADVVNAEYNFVNRDGGYITDQRFNDVSTEPLKEKGVRLCKALSGNQNYFGIRLSNGAGVGREMSNLPVIFRHITERKATNHEYSQTLHYKFFVDITKAMAIDGGIATMMD
tara:strand:- start:4851 stop:7355 length:2505 start_codon:yes stop_codon:yes gene_type:complete